MSYYFDMAKEVASSSAFEADLANVKDDVAEIKAAVHRIDKAIRGNERPGLMQRTASLEVSRDRADKRRKTNRAWCFGLVASLCVGGIGWLLRRISG